MTFGYIGYIWAILGCSLLALFVLGTGVTLHAIGRRAERRRGGRAVVDSVDLARRTGDPRAPKDDGEAA